MLFGHSCSAGSALPITLMRHCHTAAERYGNSRIVQRHLDARERAEHHELVDVADMPDAEDFPDETARTAAERQVVAAERDVDDLLRVEAIGHHDGRDRVRVDLGVEGAELETR